MNAEVTLLLIFSTVVAIASILYFFSPSFTKYLLGESDPFERKIFHEHLPFWQVMMLTVFLPAMVTIMVWLYFSIIERPSQFSIPFNDKFVLVTIMFSTIIASYATGSHGASVSISHYMKDQKETKAFETVEFYHHIVSHLLAIIGSFGVIFGYALLELNHPLPISLPFWQMILMVIGGGAVGVTYAFLIIEGRGKYYGFPLLAFGLFFLVYLTYQLGIEWAYYPATTYFGATLVSSVLTMLVWRMKNGEMKETIGEFFHTTEKPVN